jgi:hypothetical protein
LLLLSLSTHSDYLAMAELQEAISQLLGLGSDPLLQPERPEL